MKPYVTDGSNKSQVKQAEVKMKLTRDKELSDLRAILQTHAGRRFLWRLISECRVFETIWDNSARIHYNAGRQDMGHFIQAEILEADTASYLLMQQEAWKEEQNNG